MERIQPVVLLCRVVSKNERQDHAVTSYLEQTFRTNIPGTPNDLKETWCNWMHALLRPMPSQEGTKESWALLGASRGASWFGSGSTLRLWRTVFSWQETLHQPYRARHRISLRILYFFVKVNTLVMLYWDYGRSEWVVSRAQHQQYSKHTLDMPFVFLMSPFQWPRLLFGVDSPICSNGVISAACI